jgi:PIN domain nuclease of toxin-antitoxin system
MNFYVADTHALFWYLTASPRLGANAKTAFDDGVAGVAVIYIPAIVLAELFFLNEKLGQPLDFSKEFKRFEQSGQFEFVGFEPDDVKDFTKDAAVPEMHDRIVVGVARRLALPCLTYDTKIIASNLVKIVW